MCPTRAAARTVEVGWCRVIIPIARLLAGRGAPARDDHALLPHFELAGGCAIQPLEGGERKLRDMESAELASRGGGGLAHRQNSLAPLGPLIDGPGLGAGRITPHAEIGITMC